MTKNVLLLGRIGNLLDDMKQQLRIPDVQLFGGTGVDDVRSTFAKTHIDHVIVGGGIDLDARLQIVREIFLSSDRTTVHMKDQISGPEGFVPFVQSVLRGVESYEFQTSPTARLLAQQRSNSENIVADGQQ